MTPGLTRPAHAKLNLALSVGPPDAAGMHPIASWMAPIDLADEVRLTALSVTTPSEYAIDWAADAPRPSPIDWPLERDLAVRAHRVLEAEAGRRLPVRLEVRKRIPVGGGLGGGSSDAAAALMGMNELFDLGLAEARLVELSRSLGSDVAFFLDTEAAGTEGRGPRPAIVTGLGDRVERVERIPGEVVLILPEVGCPTGAVYRAYDELGPVGLREAEVRKLAARAVEEGRIPWGDLFNDLAAPAAHAVPPFAAVLESVRSAGNAPVHVSGSGSTLFLPILTGGSAVFDVPRATTHRTRLV